MSERTRKIVWAFLAAASFLLFYVLPNRLTAHSGATNVQFDFERHIPLVPETVVAYLAIFPYVILSFYNIQNYRQFRNAVFAIFVIGFVSGIIFFIFPSTMARPLVLEDNPFSWVLGTLHELDRPYNLFPSLHVSFSVLTALIKTRIAQRLKFFHWGAAALISISTLFVKQHALVDIAGGIIVAVLAFSVFIVLEKNFSRGR